MRNLTVILGIIAISVVVTGCIPKQAVIAPGAQGTIVDAQTGQPITNAKIEQVAVDEQGKFNLPANTEIGMAFPFVGGNYRIERSFTISAPGYDSRSCNCTTITPDPSCDDLVISLQTESPVTTAPKVYVIGSDSGEKVGDNTFCSVPIEKSNTANEQIKQLEQASQNGSIDALYQLGQRYSEGNGVPQDKITGLYMLEQAAEQGHPEALDYVFSLAHQGNIDAMVFVGDIYYLGNGIPQDIKQGMQWYMAAVQLASPQAMLRLGDAYSSGEWIRINRKKALFWYQQAAITGSAEAMFELAEAYRSGELGPIDLEKSVHWWIKAADAGSLRARDMLQQTLEADDISQKTKQPILEWEKRQEK